MATTRDVWAESLYAASFAGIPLDVLVTQDELMRHLAELEYPRKDGADIQPMGNAARRSRLQVLFYERDPDEDDDAAGFASDDHVTRAFTFIATALAATEPQTFVHPLFGEYQAWVRNLEVGAQGGERNVIAVDVEMVEDSTSPSVILAPDLAPHHSTIVDVTALAQEFDEAVADLELDEDAVAPGLGDDITETVTKWDTDPDIGTRDVNGDISRLTDAIDDALNEIEYATNLDRFPIFRTLARLSGSLRRAGDQFRKLQPQIGEHIVAEGGPLPAIVVEIYKTAKQWERRRDEMQRLNDIPDPGYIPGGTRLRYVLANPVGIATPLGARGKVAR